MTAAPQIPPQATAAAPAAGARAKRRIAWAGLAVNLPLAVGKISIGLVAGSPALVADGVHSLSDLASDVTVLWALGHSARGPDREHPWGHGRFETLATLAVALALTLAAAGILWDAGARLAGGGVMPQPGLLALLAALGSVLIKEALFHATLRVGRRTGSRLLMANAWHHRSDALSSVVAAAGIGGGMLGWPLLDPLAAAVIAAMLLRVAWTYGRPAVDELVDAQAPEAERAALAATLRDCPGVTGLRALRLRRHGAERQADVSILVDPQITVTEAHRISEAAHERALAAHPALGQLVIHVEPAGHEEGYGATAAPLRHEVEARLCTILAQHWPGVTLQQVRLDYFDHGIEIEIFAEARDDTLTRPEVIGADLTARLRRSLPGLAELRLRPANARTSSAGS